MSSLARVAVPTAAALRIMSDRDRSAATLSVSAPAIAAGPPPAPMPPGASLGRHKARGGEPAAATEEYRSGLSTSCRPASPGAPNGGAAAVAALDTVMECLARTAASWYMPDAGRRDAERALAGRSTGAFVLCSTAGGSYCLSIVVPAPGYRRRRSFRSEARAAAATTKVSHQLVVQSPADGTYRLQASSVPFDSVTRLVAFYCIQRDVLPSLLRLPPAAHDLVPTDVQIRGAARRSEDDSCHRCSSSSSSQGGRLHWPDSGEGPASAWQPNRAECRGGAALGCDPELRAAARPSSSYRVTPKVTSPGRSNAAACPGSGGSGCAEQQQQWQQWRQRSPPPTPPPRRRRFLPVPAAAAAADQSSPSCGSGCGPGAPATLPAASMATVYTTTATLQKPMHLTYDVASDQVHMSSAEGGGVFSDGSVATSTKAVICIGDAVQRCGDTDLNRDSSCSYSTRAPPPPPIPLRAASAVRGCSDTTGAARLGSGSGTTDDAAAAVYYASALDDRLSDYEDIWSPSPGAEPSGSHDCAEPASLPRASASAAGGSGLRRRGDGGSAATEAWEALRCCAPAESSGACQIGGGRSSSSAAVAAGAGKSSSSAAAAASGSDLPAARPIRLELTANEDPLGGSGASYLLADGSAIVGGTSRRGAGGLAASGSGAALALQLSSGSGGVAATARRLTTPGSHRRGSQQPAAGAASSGSAGGSLKVSPVRCDIIRAAPSTAAAERTAGAAAAAAAVTSATSVPSRQPSSPGMRSRRLPATAGAAGERSPAPAAAVADIWSGPRARHLLVPADSGTDVSNRDSGAVDNDCEDDIERRVLEFMCNMTVGSKSGVSVVRTTSLKEKATTAVPVLPLKPQTLPVHLLRKPDFEEPVSPAHREASPHGGDHVRTPSEIADELAAACSSSLYAGDADFASPPPLRCPKFPLSLRLSSGSGGCDDAATASHHADRCGGGGGASPPCLREQPSALRKLIESALPECVLPAICPLTSSNLQRLSTYDNVSLLSQRPSNRLSSGSSSTVFSKPWDASRIEEIFQNARVRSRINTSALSETTEDDEDGGGGGGGVTRQQLPTGAGVRLQGLPTGGRRPDAGEEDGQGFVVDDVVRPAVAVASPLQQSAPITDAVTAVAGAAAAEHGRAAVVLLRQRPGRASAAAAAAAPVQPGIVEPARASKYRRSIDFNRDAISARSNCGDSPKDLDGEEGDSGTELEAAAGHGDVVGKKQERVGAEPQACGSQAKSDFVMVYNDSQASLQTFSEQVKLMRSPSMNAGGGRSSSGGTALPSPSAVIQEHVCKLARDKCTTFGSAVDHFIRCTRESNEPNPHVMLRNVRQFMSGIKNYLTQQGEGSFTELVHSVQRKLAPNEFLNIDTVLEAALLKCVVFPLKATVDKVFVAYYTSNGSLKELAEGIRVARSRSAVELGMKASFVPPQGQSMEMIQSWFDKMQKASSPVRKLENLLSACSAIFTGMRFAGESAAISSLAAEDFLVVMTYVVAQCGLVTAEVEADYMRGLLQASLSSGEGGYYLNTLSSSVTVIKSLARCRRSSLQLQRTAGTAGSGGGPAAAPAGSGGLLHRQPASSHGGLAYAGGSVRVHVPNETTGSIMTRTIPVRPCMTAKEIRAMVAHKLFITNPQDYALYVVASGVEHRLSDSDTVDGFVVGTTAAVGVSATATSLAAVVFKRISAHIVWPSVMC